ncbi:hypothetical protein [Lutibacter citreus]|uniref:hypothetical protein n=1 Tax=Lutibacter citreus TaxID=2138210 RepID=UPI000DBE39F2|nr:hypothetical protein [Lutibacter citreus]
MITINDKLYITKEVNNIVVSYAKTIVLRKLLINFSFKKDSKNKIITDHLESVNHCKGVLDVFVEEEMDDFIYPFVKNLDKDETTALHFWTLNKLYLKYFQDSDYNDDDGIDIEHSDADFDFKFGRKLAHKIYEPEFTELDNDLIKELKNLLANFASEFDLSMVTKYTRQNILETIENYCS